MSKTNGKIIVCHLPFLVSIPRVLRVQEGRGPMDRHYGRSHLNGYNWESNTFFIAIELGAVVARC